MRVNIGPYVKHHNGRRIENWYIKLRHKKENFWDVDLSEGDFIDRLIYKLIENVVFPICQATINPFNNWRGRRIKVKVDKYDTWSMDSTLAYIIHPMLLQLRDHKHGAPYVYPEDVPEHMRPSQEPDEENKYIDDTHFQRWEWVLEEMIWTFSIYNTDWEDDYYTPPVGEWSLNNRGKIDSEGVDQTNERLENGLRLFGKYFRNLWN